MTGSTALVALLAALAVWQRPSAALQLSGWNPALLTAPAGPEATVPARAPIAAELQNQVNALGAQIAAAGRQLQYFQQQLSMVRQQEQQQQQQQQPRQLLQQQQQQQVQPQIQLFHQQHQPASGQFSNPQAQFAGQPAAEERPFVSTLVDDGQPQPQPQQAHFQHPSHQHQQQHQHQPATLSTTLSPPASSLESTVSAEQPQPPQSQAQLQPQSQPQPQPQPQPQLLQPGELLNRPAPHQPARNDDKFAIGLGVLSPGYTQKFGNTALDFNQDKNGFSFTLSNNGHSNEVPKVPQVKPAP